MDRKKAEKLCKIEGAAMAGLVALGLFSMGTVAAGTVAVGTVWESLKIGGGAVNLAVMAASFVGAFLVGKSYWRHKDEATYDEFGVRRDEKRRMEMDSKERRQLELQSLAELEKVLPRNTIEKITHGGSADPEADLDSLVGIAPVKERLIEMKARMEFEEQELLREEKGGKGRKREEAKRNGEGHHMVFYGAPGTGKTTVARIVTGILWDYEYIDRNELVEVDGNFLKSSDSSMTETKVRFVCRAAYGGVLFIDEAYALGEDEVGAIAIATLIKEMEDNRDKFVVILAGYKEPMSDMLSVNPGFKSRIKEYLEFPDYSSKEMCEIFVRMAKSKGFEVDKGAEHQAARRFATEMALSSWGNARTARNVLEESIDKHAVRCMKNEVDEEHRRVILPEDIATEPKSLL